MRGEWIEMLSTQLSVITPRLSPCGESGLKYLVRGSGNGQELSLPMRGEWIEMPSLRLTQRVQQSLPMRGEWIEIIRSFWGSWENLWSLPMRGEWIEMLRFRPGGHEGRRSLPMRGEWIEIEKVLT